MSEDLEEIDRADAASEAVRDDVIHLRAGTALDLDGVARLGSGRPFRLIVLAGEPSSGKTTLLAALYELFFGGSVASWSFAGSVTLVGFETLCHESRGESGLMFADTERTLGATTYLHLRLGRETSLCDVVFSDVPGEDFRYARDQSIDALRLAYIRRADRFVLLLDGEKISDPGQRQAVVQNARMLLRSLLECGMLGAWSSVDVIFSKADLFSVSAASEQTGAFMKSSREKLRGDFSKVFGSFTFYELAARPPATAPDRDTLSELLNVWMSGTQSTGRRRPRPVTADIESPFERFALFSSESSTDE